MSRTQILIVEDDPIIARDINQSVTCSGYGVAAMASSGEEAVRKAVERQPDLVLMDIVLKGNMDGIETAACIHARRDIPVVYLSAYSDVEILKRAMKTYPYGYLVKPFTDRELAVAIEIALVNHETNQWVKQHEQWLAATLQSMSDGVISTDLQGDVMFMNPVAERLTGWLQVNALGKNLSQVLELIREESRTHIDNAVRQVLKGTGEVVQLGYQIHLSAKNRTECQIQGSLSPIRDQQDMLLGTVLILREVHVMD